MKSATEADGPPEQPAAQQNMFEGSHGSNQDNPEKRPIRGPVNLPGTQSLERLRDRIELTVNELSRLRAENTQLQKQLHEARSHGLDSIEGTPVVFSESPAALRSKVEGLIGALDRYIEQAATSNDDGQQSP